MKLRLKKPSLTQSPTFASVIIVDTVKLLITLQNKVVDAFYIQDYPELIGTYVLQRGKSLRISQYSNNVENATFTKDEDKQKKLKI
jgi:hypothetical protein